MKREFEVGKWYDLVSFYSVNNSVGLFGPVFDGLFEAFWVDFKVSGWDCKVDFMVLSALFVDYMVLDNKLKTNTLLPVGLDNIAPTIDSYTLRVVAEHTHDPHVGVLLVLIYVDVA